MLPQSGPELGPPPSRSSPASLLLPPELPLELPLEPLLLPLLPKPPEELPLGPPELLPVETELESIDVPASFDDAVVMPPQPESPTSATVASRHRIREGYHARSSEQV
jgi:hypothetical protein